jgi:hypothetical protein
MTTVEYDEKQQQQQQSISPKLVERAIQEAAKRNIDSGVCTIVTILDGSMFTWYSRDEFAAIKSVSRKQIETILTRLCPGEIRVVKIEATGAVHWMGVALRPAETLKTN